MEKIRKNSYNTKYKQIILEYLSKNSNNTYSIKDIEDFLKSMKIQVNITTIYRNMEKLYKENYLMKYVSNDGKNIAYQFVDNLDECTEHLHIQCIKCGKVIHLDCEYMSEIKRHILEIHNFELNCEKSILYGVCENCKK